MIYTNILQTIGKTPLVKINKLAPKGVNIYAKMESFNPGSSIKDRIALNMIEDAQKKGLLKKGGTIIEPTSGNTGIGIAIVAAVKGYNAVFTMPSSMSVERRNILKFLGAKIILTPGEKGMNGAIKKAEELVKERGYFMPQQFNNSANPQVHRITTGPEIVDDMGKDDVDYFIAGVGTGGTITGAGEALKKQYPKIQVIAVEPMDSPVLSGGKAGPHKIQGIGAGFIPQIYNGKVVDQIIKVKNEDAFETSRKLAKIEGIMVGISAGANMFAALQIANDKKTKGKTLVVIFPDTAERYLSTELFEND